MSRLSLIPAMALALMTNAEAQASGSSTNISIEKNNSSRVTADLQNDETRLARQWGLQEDEFKRYRALMQGPLGTYSPNLDPLSALGIEAQSEDERQRYAKLQVEAEAARVEKLLAYQRAYDDAWKVRYPGLMLISLPPMNSPLIKAASRVAVFVQYDCPNCEHQVKQLNAAGTPFDLYVVGSRQDDKRIRDWAKKVGIQSSRIRDGTITLNHDRGRWLSVGAEGELPAVMREVNGKWLRQ
ncbi:TIGR03759 family integrating conjugative element protein [Pseudomonas synxantha]|uniref:Integrating conjugative element protein (TIGR03759 family) n=1 Tax=Pseudomonas synxantha TaxID=47883 RepID=A0ACC6JVX8_9PSED|nr:TIGR03759 family integrating conjugative element protein [Pseudomonas synxantha]MDR6610550.1 integrating conjugative element protein (TIGR03759 family) [Pseudomonas synxantha]